MEHQVDVTEKYEEQNKRTEENDEISGKGRRKVMEENKYTASDPKTDLTGVVSGGG